MSRPIYYINVEGRYFSRLSDRALILYLEAWGSPMLNSISRLGKTIGPDPNRNGRMERSFPIITIFKNFRQTSRGTTTFFRWKPWQANVKFEKKTDKNSVIAISIVYFLQAHFFIVEISRTTTIHPIVFIPQERPR